MTCGSRAKHFLSVTDLEAVDPNAASIWRFE
jgi:hypothetical protein